MPISIKGIIADKFEKIARQKSIDRITVKELVDACGISRQTFYYHFEDITDLIEWSVEQHIKELTEKIIHMEDPRDGIYMMVSFVQENRSLIRRLLDSQRHEQIVECFQKSVQDFLWDIIREKYPELQKEMSVYELEIMVEFSAFGIMGILLSGCKKEKADQQEISDQIYKIFARLSEMK